MRSTLQPPQITELDINDFLNPLEIIDAMIELKIQLQELERQIQALQPAFFAACLALNTEKIERSRDHYAQTHARSMDVFDRNYGTGGFPQTT